MSMSTTSSAPLNEIARFSNRSNANAITSCGGRDAYSAASPAMSAGEMAIATTLLSFFRDVVGELTARHDLIYRLTYFLLDKYIVRYNHVLMLDTSLRLR